MEEPMTRPVRFTGGSHTVAPMNWPTSYVTLNGVNIRAGRLRCRKSVALLDGDFFRILKLVRHLPTGEVFLRGWRLRRCSFMDGMLPRKANELCMMLDAFMHDPRPELVQGQSQVSVKEVEAIRRVVFTNRPFPALSYRETEQVIPNPLLSTWLRKAPMVCRYKAITYHDDLGRQGRAATAESSLQVLSFAEADPGCGVPNEELRSNWLPAPPQGDGAFGSGLANVQAADAAQAASATPWSSTFSPARPGRDRVVAPFAASNSGSSTRPIIVDGPLPSTAASTSSTIATGPNAGRMIVLSGPDRSGVIDVDATGQGQATASSSQAVDAEVDGDDDSDDDGDDDGDDDDDDAASMTSNPEWVATVPIGTSSVSSRPAMAAWGQSASQTRGHEDEAEPTRRHGGHSSENTAARGGRPTYSFGDAFCGAGGMSCGAVMAGLEVKWGLDYDRAALDCFLANFGGAVGFHSEVNKFLSIASTAEHVDILHLSPPCRTFSPAHTVAGQEDDANEAAFLSMVPMVQKVRPRMVVFENTFGLLERHDSWFHAQLHGLAQMGFSMRWALLNCGDYGNPQFRRRVFMFASCPGESLPRFPNPSHGPHSGLGGAPSAAYQTVRQAISAIPDGHPHHDVRGAKARSREPYPADRPLPLTLTTSGGGNYHFSGTRDYTLRELACLQSFPLTFKFGAKGVKKQIGNAVPPVAARALLLAVKRALWLSDGVPPEELEIEEIDD